MEPPPPTSPSENPTSAPETTAALIIAIMVALPSWACRNERIVSCHADEHGDHEERTRADGEGRQASEGMTASTFLMPLCRSARRGRTWQPPRTSCEPALLAAAGRQK